QRSVYQKFTEALVQRMSAIKVGPGTASDTGCGALINHAAVEKIEALLAEAVDRGARVVLGGSAPAGPGCFFPPTVLMDVPPGAAILQQEIFGPVAVLVPFETIAEAIAAANDTEYGLVAYLYTAD